VYFRSFKSIFVPEYIYLCCYHCTTTFRQLHHVRKHPSSIPCVYLIQCNVYVSIGGVNWVLRSGLLAGTYICVGITVASDMAATCCCSMAELKR